MLGKCLFYLDQRGPFEEIEKTSYINGTWNEKFIKEFLE